MERPMDKMFEAISSPKTSRIHLLDVENLVGSGILTEYQVHELCDDYVRCTNCEADDLFLLAAGPQNRSAAVNGWSFGYSLYKFKKGKDGADQALVYLFEQIENPEKYSQIYLATGDGGLASIAETVNRLGIDLTVVSGKGKVSSEYRGYKHIKLSGNHR